MPPVPVLAEPVSSSGDPAYYFPGIAMMALSITVFGMCYALAPAGSARRWARWGAMALLAAVGLSKILLAAVYPSAAAYAIALAATVAFVVLTWLAPDEAFPVSYAKGGNAAHLDLSGARSDAVKRAMSDQVGVAVTEVKAFGNEGSGGSTPLLMTADDGTRIFGKILATSHARADRWYRIGRTIMYGKLEDEAPFGSVRRLIGYEDYALRLLDDDGFRIAKTYGVVELTPNREYLLPTEFFEGSETLGHADVNDTIIDEGLALIRRLWDEGLAHRDIKPANLLVVDGHLQLIDVSGLEVRPSPWRQAVDLANMMLVMALKSDPDRVYEIALRHFTPEDVGEAFACAVGMAIPTELQRYLKEDGRDLVGRFKELAPHHAPVSIQRWSAAADRPHGGRRVRRRGGRAGRLGRSRLRAPLSRPRMSRARRLAHPLHRSRPRPRGLRWGEDAPPPTTALGDDAITVASFDFPESRVLAEIYAQALEGRGVPRGACAGHRTAGAGRARAAAGTGGAVSRSTREARSRSSAGRPRATRRSPTNNWWCRCGTRGLTALSPAPAQDRNAFAMLASTAEEFGRSNAQRPGPSRRRASSSEVRPNASSAICA